MWNLQIDIWKLMWKIKLSYLEELIFIYDSENNTVEMLQNELQIVYLRFVETVHVNEGYKNLKNYLKKRYFLQQLHSPVTIS